MSSFSVSETFTITHAKYIASKVASDLYQCSKLYGTPSPAAVDKYQDELVVMLHGGYVESYEFGFKRDGKRIVSWQYKVNAQGDLVGGSDDRSGGVYSRADVAAAEYFNFMSYSRAWFALSSDERESVRSQHPVSRTTGSLPSDGNGYWELDRSYSSGGAVVERRTFRPL